MPICNDPTQHDIGVFPDKKQEEQLDAIAMLKGMEKMGFFLLNFMLSNIKKFMES